MTNEQFEKIFGFKPVYRLPTIDKPRPNVQDARTVTNIIKGGCTVAKPVNSQN